MIRLSNSINSLIVERSAFDPLEIPLYALKLKGTKEDTVTLTSGEDSVTIGPGSKLTPREAAIAVDAFLRTHNA